jgi:hypothetical protein
MMQLDLSNSIGKIFFRRFDAERGRYGADNTAFPGHEDGIYSFQYGKDGFR